MINIKLNGADLRILAPLHTHFFSLLTLSGDGNSLQLQSITRNQCMFGGYTNVCKSLKARSWFGVTEEIIRAQALREFFIDR